jgi:hypothetical protein
MYLSDADPAEALAVWSFEYEIGDEEFLLHCDDIRALKGWPHPSSKGRPAVLLTLDEVPRLSALQRQTLATLVDSPHYDPYIAIVSASPLIRGVLVALRWLNPTPCYKESTHGNIESALEWLQLERGGELPKLRLMVERLGQKATGDLLKRFAHHSMRMRAHSRSP